MVDLLGRRGLQALVVTALLFAPVVALGLGVVAVSSLPDSVVPPPAKLLAFLAGMALSLLAPGLLALGSFATFGTALREEAPALRPLLSIALRRLPALAFVQLLPGVMHTTAFVLGSMLREVAWTGTSVGALAAGAYGALIALALWRACSVLSIVIFLRPWRRREEVYHATSDLLRRENWPWLVLSGAAPLAVFGAAFLGPLHGRDLLAGAFGGSTADLIVLATRLTGLALGLLVDAAATAAFVRTRSRP